MVTDKQVRKLLQLLLDDRAIARAARLTNMDEKTARKYRDLGKLPSELAQPHTWTTRPNPFATVWEGGVASHGDLRRHFVGFCTWCSLSSPVGLE